MTGTSASAAAPSPASVSACDVTSVANKVIPSVVTISAHGRGGGDEPSARHDQLQELALTKKPGDTVVLEYRPRPESHVVERTVTLGPVPAS